MLGNLIGGFITLIIGTTLIDPIADSVYAAQNSNGTNITGASSTILGLTTLFFSLGIMASGISIAVQGLRQAGVL